MKYIAIVVYTVFFITVMFYFPENNKELSKKCIKEINQYIKDNIDNKQYKFPDTIYYYQFNICDREIVYTSDNKIYYK